MNEFKRSPVTTSNEQIFYNATTQLVTADYGMILLPLCFRA